MFGQFRCIIWVYSTLLDIAAISQNVSDGIIISTLTAEENLLFFPLLANLNLSGNRLCDFGH
jgi:hypothetical protein